MNTISPPKKGNPANDRDLEGGTEESIPPHSHEINITEGGEFLDDAIRTEDEPNDEVINKPSQRVSYKHLF